MSYTKVTESIANPIESKAKKAVVNVLIEKV